MKEVVRNGLIVTMLVILVWFAFLLRATQGFEEHLLPAGLVTMTLGLTLLAAHIFGRFLATFGFPLITGYLLAGIFLGPEGLGLVGLEVRDRLLIINRIALGLIALTAGGELALERLKPRLRTIGWVTALHTILIFTATAAGLLAWEVVGRQLGFESALTAGLGAKQIVVIGLLLGLVATANSPASTVAVINEVRARGPMTTIALGTTVVKDVVVILLMALTLMLGKGILDPASDLDASQLARIPVEVAISLVLGSLIGLGIIFYLGRVNKEVALFVLAVVILTIELVEYLDLRLHLHLDFLLVCIAAGFVVENISEKGELLIQGLERSSLPVYVVFFTFSGVGLDLTSLLQIWPLALGFIVWRAILLYTTTWIGAARAGEPIAIREHTWTAFIAQAGVSLGLAELVAMRLPAIGERLRTFVLAVVALNQLVGPALFKISLKKLGEAGRADLPEKG